MLELKNVSYSYSKKKESRVVLDDVNVKFEMNKLYAIFGASGEGKTTLLSLLGGLDVPKRGSITLDGKPLKEIGFSNLRRHYVSYVFQDYHLFPYLTPVENVELAMRISKISTRRADAVTLLRSLDLDDQVMNRQVRMISGGQQQRTAIARALICRPFYIFADEPTGNLDNSNTIRIMEILSNIAHNQNRCVVVATHSDFVRSFADIQLELFGGTLREVTCK